jgi:PAS domain S-box-containing protein
VTARVLIVEDKRVVARDVGEHLTRLGYSVAGVTASGEEAVRLAEGLRPDLVLMDIRLEGDTDGVEAARQIRERLGLPVVYLTAYADAETLQRAKVTEPFGYVLKPFEERELRTVIEIALYKHQAERKLRESERRYAVTLSSIGDAVIATDERGRVTFLNPAAGSLTGWPPAGATGRPLAEVFRIVNEYTRQPVEDPAAKALRSGVVVGLANHTVLLARDGRELPIDDCGAPIVDDKGAVTGAVLVFHDVTDQRRAEEELRRSEERYRRLFESNPHPMWVFDAETLRFLAVNDAAVHRYGYTRDEFLSMTIADIRPPEDVPAMIQGLRGLANLLQPGRVWRHRWKDGTVREVDVSSHPLWYGDRPARIVLALDVTDRKLAEEALRQSHALLNAVVEGTSDAVFVKDHRGRYLMINSAGARRLDRPADEIVGRDDGELLPPAVARPILERDRRVMAAGEAQVFEETTEGAGDRRSYLTTKAPLRDARGEVIGLVGIARDVTELKQLEEQFRQAQKMEAVGRLAGGVAHDFNNLLTVINGFSELVFEHLRPDDPSWEPLVEVRRAAERAATLTRQLLAFSSRQVLQPQVVSLNALLDDLLKLLKRLIGEDVELAFVPDPDLGLARVDPGQFEQAVINLAVNARDAMPRGGRLTIESRNAELDAGHAERNPELKPGPYVQVAMADTGHGMDEATKARIFEPFFTTKEPGKGTGLGLAMVYGFVKQSGGHIEVDSEAGRGTTFRVYLPRAEAAATSPKSSPGLLKIPKGTETVLLVEDEEAVRTLARLALQSSGYTVLEARDGQEGVWVAQQHPGPIHLLVTDLVMPRMSGRQLSNLLAEARPGLRVLLVSGYTDEAVVSHGVGEAGVAFLQKPFSPTTLAQKVREVLDQKP